MAPSAEDVLHHIGDWLRDPVRQEQEVLDCIQNILDQTGESVEFIWSAIGILQNNKGQVLLLHRPSLDRAFPDSYCLPGGGYEEEDQHLEGTVIRETFQETGHVTTVQRPHSVRYAAIPHRKRIYKVAIFYLLSHNADPDVVVLSEEHDAYAWVDKQALLAHEQKIVFSGKITREIVEGLLKKGS